MTGGVLRVVRSWPGRDATALAWSADGRRFASAQHRDITVTTAAKDADPTADPAQPSDDDTRVTTPGPVLSLAFGSAGDVLLAAPFTIEWPSGSLVQDLTPALTDGLPSPAVRGFGLDAAAFTPDGRAALLSGQYRPPRGLPSQPGWSGPTKRVILTDGDSATLLWSEGVGRFVLACADSVAAFADTTVRIVRRTPPGTEPRPQTLGGHDTAVRALAFGPGGKLLAAGFADGNVVVWSLSSGLESARWQAHDTDVLTLDWAGDRLVTGGSDGSVRLFDADGGALAGTDPQSGRPVVALAAHPEGHAVLAALRGTAADVVELDLTAS